MTTLAIAGGRQAVRRSVPAWPVAGDLEVAWMEGVIRSGHWSWRGPHETAFQREFAGFIGSKHAITLANGTVTMQCALQALGVVPGDEVIVPGLTWVATAQAAMDIGATVVFADIDPRTLTLCPRSFETCITPRTKAVIPVHLYGAMCDMDAIMDIAGRHGLKVLEDVAHQHGSRWRGRGAGAIGHAGSFSFQQSKVLTCGEGGAVTTDADEVHDLVFTLKQVGWKPDLTPGNQYCHNYRLTEMQAVLLRGGLTRLPEQTRRREAAALRLADGLDRLGGPLSVVRPDPRVTRQAYYALTLYFDPEKAGLPRDAYQWAAAEEGLCMGTTYPPVYRAPLMNLYAGTSPIPYRDPKTTPDYRNLKLPNVEKAVGETALVLGHSCLLGDDAYIDELLAAADKINGQLPAVRAAWEKKQAALRTR